MELTRGGWSASKARAQLETAKKTLGRIRDKAEASMGTMFGIVEVGGASFGMSYLNQRYGNGEYKVFGVPADLVGAGALHAVALFDGLGRHAEHGHNIANGLLAGYLARMGAKAGSDARAKDQQAAGGTGWMPAGSREMGSGGTGWQSAEDRQRQQYQPQRAA